MELSTRSYLRPSHYNDYTVKINNFSLLQAAKGAPKYESDTFEVAGYKWSLHLYPNGDKEQGGEGYISLYLKIKESDGFAAGWEVFVNYKLFVLDQKDNSYVTFQGERRCYSERKQLGFAQLLSLENFKSRSKGFLVNDSCVFGAEVSVLKKYTKKSESLTMVQLDSQSIRLTKLVTKFSQVSNSGYDSGNVTIGGRTWKLKVYPKGSSGSRNYLSIYLVKEGWSSPQEKVYAQYRLRICDQLNGNHCDTECSSWFSRTNPSNGYQMVSLEDLQQPSKGFLRNDTLIVEVKMHVLGREQPIPSSSA